MGAAFVGFLVKSAGALRAGSIGELVIWCFGFLVSWWFGSVLLRLSEVAYEPTDLAAGCFTLAVCIGCAPGVSNGLHGPTCTMVASHLPCLVSDVHIV